MYIYIKEQVQLTWSRANIFLFEIEWAALTLQHPVCRLNRKLNLHFLDLI